MSKTYEVQKGMVCMKVSAYNELMSELEELRELVPVLKASAEQTVKFDDLAAKILDLQTRVNQHPSQAERTAEPEAVPVQTVSLHRIVFGPNSDLYVIPEDRLSDFKDWELNVSAAGSLEETPDSQPRWATRIPDDTALEQLTFWGWSMPAS